MRTTLPTPSELKPFLEGDETVRQVFMGCNFGVTMLEGGSTRIIAVTDRAIAVIVGGLIHRTTPQRLEARRDPIELRDPDTVWPGRSLYGEEWGQVMYGLWVHVRYRDHITMARKRIAWLYG